MNELETNRLKLRQWLPSDYAPFAELNTDLQVMKYFPNTLSQTESNASAKKMETIISNQGWGFWAVELKSRNSFIGFVGLHQAEVELPFSPCVEIGWRLSKKYWNNGYATEAARSALKFAFEILKLKEVVSFTSLKNQRSEALMQRLNMINTNQNFQHPKLPIGHQLREHVLYKITKDSQTCQVLKT
jgi:RimJ/RimL family protein N-acetyltransferase